MPRRPGFRTVAVGIALWGSAGCAAVLPTPASRGWFTAPTPGGTVPSHAGLLDARGAIHLHSHASDGTGTVETIAHLARKTDLSFIIITDYNTLVTKSEERLTGHPLVLVGTEIATSAGHLLALGIAHDIPRDQPVEQVLEAVHAQGGLAIAAHPRWPKGPWTRWDLPLDGLEIFDFSTMLSHESPLWLLLKALTLPNPTFWRITLRRPDTALALWDERTKAGPLIGIAGHGTHAHVGLGPFVLDSYQSGFRLVATHVLVSALTAEALYEGIRRGRCYVGFDGIADPRPFVYTVEGGGRVTLMGDRVPFTAGLTAIVRLPTRGTCTFFRDGQSVGHRYGVEAQWPITQPGTYRVEVSLGNRPWIFSNPIYIEPAADEKT